MLASHDVSRFTLRAWRKGRSVTTSRGQPHTYPPILTEGVHYILIGRAVAYTDEGLRYIRRHIKRRGTAGT